MRVAVPFLQTQRCGGAASGGGGAVASHTRKNHAAVAISAPATGSPGGPALTLSPKKASHRDGG